MFQNLVIFITSWHFVNDHSYGCCQNPSKRGYDLDKEGSCTKCLWQKNVQDKGAEMSKHALQEIF